MIYFDNAATSYPKPRGVVREVRGCIKKCGGNPGRGAHILALRASEKVYSVREKLCTLFSFDKPENVVFTASATHALNLAIMTRVKRGSHILISDMEHNAVLRVAALLEKRGIATYDIFKTHGNVVENIRDKVRQNTDIIVCNHVSNVSGRRQDIERIGAFCRKNCIYFVVDASQSVGHMRISFDKIGANAICAPAHKGLFGLQGAGFLMLREAEGLAEFMVGGSGMNSNEPYMPEVLPERYEAGTLPTPAIASLGAGVDYVNNVGLEEIAYREACMSVRAREILSDIRGARVFAEDEGGVLSFNIDAIPQAKIADALCREGICVRGGLHCAPLAHRTLGTDADGAVRLSFSCRNRPRELEKMYKALKGIGG